MNECNDTLKVVRIHQHAKLPEKNNITDAGYDLSSCECITIEPLTRAMVRTGLVINVPKGTYGRIAPRSGLALKYGIDVLAGVVDTGYIGEVKVILFNTGDTCFNIKEGDRIAQLIVEKISYPSMIEYHDISDLESSSRGTLSFGSSG